MCYTFGMGGKGNPKANRRRSYIKQKASGTLRYWLDPEKRRKGIASATLRYMKVKSDFLEAYGGRCVCCGETEPVFLTMDHGGRDNGPLRRVGYTKKGKVRLVPERGMGEYYRLRKIGWPKDTGIRILCMNCNCATRRGARCPHPNGVIGCVDRAESAEIPEREEYVPPPPNMNGGRDYQATRTPEQKAEHSRKMVAGLKAWVARGSPMSDEQRARRSERMRVQWRSGVMAMRNPKFHVER